MTTFDPQPPADYAAIMVQLGVLQEGQRNTLDGIREIKETLTNHGDRLGAVESKVAVHDQMLRDSQPAKGRWTAIGSFIVATVAIVLTLLDRLYGAV